jgi:hypothetical protein
MVAALLSEFPSIEADLLDKTWSGLLHPQMGCFARYVQTHIDAGDRLCVTRCFALADRFLREGNSELRNAVAVSFLEHLNFADGKRKRAWAREFLSARLRDEIERLEEV